jgi:hypothetical protein
MSARDASASAPPSWAATQQWLDDLDQDAPAHSRGDDGWPLRIGSPVGASACTLASNHRYPIDAESGPSGAPSGPRLAILAVTRLSMQGKSAVADGARCWLATPTRHLLDDTMIESFWSTMQARCRAHRAQ